MSPLKNLMLNSRFCCSHLGNKKPSAVLLTLYLALRFEFWDAQIILNAPTVNLVFVFQSSFALPAKDEQTIRSVFNRKTFLKFF